MAIGKDLIEKIFPIELVGYFEITDYQELCSMQDKLEFIIVDFVERTNCRMDLVLKIMRKKFHIIENYSRFSYTRQRCLFAN
jgi:hypothetical protein